MEHMYQLPDMYGAIRLIGFKYAKSDRGWNYPEHRHNYFEFLHCISGTIHQWVGGERFILKAGDSLLIKAYTDHHTETPDRALFFGFHFDVESKHVHSVLLLQSSPIIDHTEKLMSGQSIADWVDEFVNEFRDILLSPPVQEVDSEISYPSMKVSIEMLHIQGRFLQFISHITMLLLDRVKSPLNTLDAVTPAQIEIAQKSAYLIEQGAHKEFKISHIASELNIHRSYINQCFKALYGISPSVYYQQIRMRQAKWMLRHSDLSIEQISRNMGFTSPGHFSHFFKKGIGQSPLRFRKQPGHD